MKTTHQAGDAASTDWSEGYVTESEYTHGYYGELNPLLCRLALLLAGIAPPELEQACELGYGQGVSLNIHAAASAVAWWGTDFNPAQAASAGALARAAGNGARAADQSFAEFAARPDLPEFDFIGLHGIWSWVSDENRALITDFIRRRLKVGGVAYISYNTQPGWAAFAPVRHLMAQHASVIGASGQGMLSRVGEAIDFFDRLAATDPAFLGANPQVSQRFASVKGQNRRYLAHEYFNQDWAPMHFASVADWLAPARLSHACSANFLDLLDSINLSARQGAFLAEIADPHFRQTVRDFMTNQQFRRDYWVKGLRRLPGLERDEALRATQVVLTVQRPSAVLKVRGALGEATMSAAVYGPILDALADQGPHALADVETAVARAGVSFAQLLEAVVTLVGTGQLAPAQPEDAARAASARTRALNAELCRKARGGGEISVLASPVTGGAVAVSRFAQLFLLARAQGHAEPAAWAAQVQAVLAAQGQKLLQDGVPLEPGPATLALLTEQATKFASGDLGMLQALGVA
jgi:SAM-dependent methyltransferase